MRVAIYGDIHSDIRNLQAVVDDAKQRGCTRFACTGDIVDGIENYPAECIDLIRSLEGVVVQGNHDYAVAGTDSLDRFNLKSQLSILHTRSLLSKDHLQWLAELPRVAKFEGFSIVHSSLSNPENWDYIYFRKDAEIELILQQSPIVFVGHTHSPKVSGIHAEQGFKSGLPIERRAIVMGMNWKYLINTGAVYAKRTKNKQASYLIFDTEKYSIELRCV